MAPPPSLYFDFSDQTPPNKQTNDSERDPDSSPPPHGDGERRRHVLLAQLPYPWRERAKPLGVGPQRLIVCVCVLCVRVSFVFVFR